MSYNNFITTFKFDIDNSISNIGNELFYLTNNTQIKGNTKFLIIDSPTSKIEGTSNNELKLTGNLKTTKNINIDEDINLKKLNLNDIFVFDSNNIINNLSLNKNINFNSDRIVINSSNKIISKDVIGQFIKLPNQNYIIRGISGIQVEESLTNNKKHFLITLSSFNKNNQTTSPTSYITYVNESGINSTLSSSIINGINPFSIEYNPPVQINPSNTAIKRTSLKLTVNPLAENWKAQKNIIYINTTAVNQVTHPIINNNLMKSRYQLIIDLNGYTWNQGDEISFFMNLSSVMSDITLKNNLSSLTKTNYSTQPTGTNLILNGYHTFNSVSNASLIFKAPLNPVLNSYFIFSYESNSTLNTVKITTQNNTDLTPIINYNSFQKLYIFKWNGSNWIEQDLLSFINYFYLYQYVIKLPTNNVIFNDTNMSNVSSQLKYAVSSADNYLSTFNTDFINISINNSISILNTLLFNYSNANNSSFTLKYLGINPNINKGIWIIK
jgi:hypothetical protein